MCLVPNFTFHLLILTVGWLNSHLSHSFCFKISNDLSKKKKFHHLSLDLSFEMREICPFTFLFTFPRWKSIERWTSELFWKFTWWIPIVDIHHKVSTWKRDWHNFNRLHLHIYIYLSWGWENKATLLCDGIHFGCWKLFCVGKNIPHYRSIV